MPERNGANPPPPKTEPASVNPAPVRYRFPRRLRITRKTDFDRAMKAGVRVADRYLVICGRANGLPDTRLGLAVGRRHGTAVQRNRVKRLVREAFRLSYPGLPRGLDLVCTPQVGAELTLARLLEALPRLATRLAHRLLPPGQGGAGRGEGLQRDDGGSSRSACAPANNRDDTPRGVEH